VGHNLVEEIGRQDLSPNYGPCHLRHLPRQEAVEVCKRCKHV
jgi:hypothetical protein